ncbi:PAS domain-containing protein [Botrimarina mediterranea]|uniref:Aerotaxis receptor n=1 Tax=Botrimarina mediterranea TaxID=2528022 RepID=A0A518KAS1_9BACT|nr:PAS domain-containing protein [Botrimarina mediterranea]QDV74889.1 Aerotaxis receptor [Botrimarina mediterranea]QDV79532.1 Aerotaxis receptor [Planctomycetes bacterium K2D]
MTTSIGGLDTLCLAVTYRLRRRDAYVGAGQGGVPGMITARVSPINESRHFAPQELFFSLTDDKGRIRYGNQVFTRVSGYSEHDLLGQPHNIIRHPDMPRGVFRLLWDYLGEGKTIAAYVKNLAADGRYYWVLAAVTPCRDGYLSVRLNPSSPMFDVVKKAYADTLSVESPLEIEHGKPYAIQKSLEHLCGAVESLGYKCYDDFMRAALCAELTARSRIADARPTSSLRVSESTAAGDLLDLHASLANLREQLGEIFRSLDVFESLSTRLVEKHEAMEELGPSLTFLSLNTHISASRLGDDGAVLSVVSRNLGERSKDADRLIATLMQRMTPACDAARAIAFDVAVAQLESEVCSSFVEELLEGDSGGDQALVAESLDSLIEELVDRCHKVLVALHSLRDDIGVMKHAACNLVGRVDQMRTAQLNGKIDIASRKNAQGFEAIFEDVARIVAEARRDCDDIIELLNTTGERLTALLSMEVALRTELGAARASTSAAVGSRCEPV